MQDLLIEYGLGTSLRRADYTEAARRGLQNALWHNSINLAELFGAQKGQMSILVEIGVQKPEAVDTEGLAEIFPYGDIAFNVVKGGLDVPRPEGVGNPTVMANVALRVALKGGEA